ncbi:MAG: hypothetical protein Q7U38_12390 [Methylobacter sp.]|nr:hypothetical protein [Methylobacter sp.]MDP2098435.1 hypothetical protein [Methylobacter sp.]MDP2427480.1 hypothetical protein [Methylobacter sp.]MDP3055066.1 hypothetical protein [Methylobacter sp.]MDP3361445.1 hypothetical protein [Methylobacter sp.]
MDIKSIGNNWFSLYPGGGSFEYNTNENPTSENYDDRCPLAQVYRHIDGEKVVVKINGQSEKSFFYKDSNFLEALDLAMTFVNEYFYSLNVQVDIFGVSQ